MPFSEAKVEVDKIAQELQTLQETLDEQQGKVGKAIQQQLHPDLSPIVTQWEKILSDFDVYLKTAEKNGKRKRCVLSRETC